jgi:hypothetical protein
MALYQDLADEGAMVPEPGGAAMRFVRDQVFARPSAAAAVITGRQADGRAGWKIQGSGISFGSRQDRGMSRRPENDRHKVLASSPDGPGSRDLEMSPPAAEAASGEVRREDAR